MPSWDFLKSSVLQTGNGRAEFFAVEKTQSMKYINYMYFNELSFVKGYENGKKDCKKANQSVIS